MPMSLRYITRKHHEAIRISGARLSKMRKSSICALSTSAIESYIGRIIVLETSDLTSMEYFTAQGLSFVFDVLECTKKAHGLAGQEGNRARKEDRNLLREFIVANRSPTGRTVEHDDRAHGASFYLGCRFKTIISDSEAEVDEITLSDLTSVLNVALELSWEAKSGGTPDENYSNVHGATVLRWMREDLGSMKRVNGVLKPADDHTTI